MDLKIRTAKILLKKEESKDPNVNHQIDLALSENSIEIKPTRLSNLMFYLIFNKDTVLPEYITTNYKNDINNSYGASPHYVDLLTPKYSKDGSRFRIKIYDEGTAFYNKIGFSAQKSIGENLEFDVEVFHIYSYLVHANKFVDEFILNSGQCNHRIGDNFQHPNKVGIEVTVMHIDEENRIVNCSATGFLH